MQHYWYQTTRWGRVTPDEVLNNYGLSQALFTSITLGMSISLMFWTSHSEVPILARCTMAASALKCYSWLSFLSVFNYMFLKEKCKKNICFIILNLRFLTSWFPTHSFSAPLKTTKNFTVLWCFVGAGEECFGNGLRFWGVNSLFLSISLRKFLFSFNIK